MSNSNLPSPQQRGSHWRCPSAYILSPGTPSLLSLLRDALSSPSTLSVSAKTEQCLTLWTGHTAISRFSDERARRDAEYAFGDVRTFSGLRGRRRIRRIRRYLHRIRARRAVSKRWITTKTTDSRTLVTTRRVALIPSLSWGLTLSQTGVFMLSRRNVLHRHRLCSLRRDLFL